MVDLPVINKKHRRPDIRMTLDYPEDYQFLERSLNICTGKIKSFHLQKSSIS